MAKHGSEYAIWLAELKSRIQSAQIKAALKVNAELLLLYWDLGRDLLEKEENSEWGNKLVPKLSKDLLKAFPGMKGFSKSNLFHIRRWVNFYASLAAIAQQPFKQITGARAKKLEPNEIVSQVVRQFGKRTVDQFPGLLFEVPWGHHLQIIYKCKDILEALFYVHETKSNNWSRATQVNSGQSMRCVALKNQSE